MNVLFVNLIKIYCLIFAFYFFLNNYFNNSKNIGNTIYNELNCTKKLQNIINLKKVIYTIILGSYDKPKRFNKQEGYDYFLFTDDNSIEQYKNTNWTLLKVPDEVKNLNVSTVKMQRFLKLHPHLYFKNYELSIYIDGTFIIKGNLDEFLLRILTPKFYFYTFEHPERNNIFQEIKQVVRVKKEKKSLGELLVKKYMEEKYPYNNGLIESCLLIRKHNDKQCINIMTKWYREIKKYSHRDQLSFNYIIWKNKIKMKYISKEYALQYFIKRKTHLIRKIYVDKKKLKFQ